MAEAPASRGKLYSGGHGITRLQKLDEAQDLHSRDIANQRLQER
jgi:hypothetical protein